MKKKAAPKIKITKLKPEEKFETMCRLREQLAKTWLKASRKYYKKPSPENLKAMHDATHELEKYLDEYC